jgi:hypothetical protein
LDALVRRVGPRFGRAEPRRVGGYLQGLLAGLNRKNGWAVAEHAGEVSPDGMQRLLRWADWTSTGSATTCATTSSSSSVTRAGC